MKCKLLCCAMLSLCFSGAWGEELFNSYPEYYKSLPDSLFSEVDRQTLINYSSNSEILSFAWSGKVNGKPRYVEIAGGLIRLDNTRLKLSSVNAFQNESVNKNDFSTRTQVYFSSAYTCIDSDLSSATGTAVRHRAVYLLNTKLNPIFSIKLPSLFASCLEVHHDKQGNIAFYSAAYRYEKDEDSPRGITFTEYTSDGRGFNQTGQQKLTTFVEPDNVYRFSVNQNQ